MNFPCTCYYIQYTSLILYTQSKIMIKNNMTDFIEDCIASLSKMGDDVKSMSNMKTLSNYIKEAIKNSCTIYLTGIGKPGYVAQKNAATLKSIMVDGQFIDACLAGHGDLGPVACDKPSLLIAMSKSGCSSELYTLFKYMKQLRPCCKIVMICMSNEIQLKKVQSCEDIDFICHVGVDPGELDGYGIVPATSNIIFEAIMSCAISEAFNDEELGMVDMCKRLQRSHPSGTLQNKVTNLLNNLQ